MSSKNIVEIVIKATDDASKKLGGLNKAFKVLSIGAAAAGAAIIAVGVVAFKLAQEAASVERLSRTFDSLADSIGENADVMMNDLRVASRGMLNDADLMQASNKLVAMGLAKTSEESAKLTEMSTQLGMAMGMDATDAAEAFALMLANQSIPRLDNFGISSGKVRDRIEELMKADANLTREQAFMNAVMEQGAITMEKVGEQGVGAAADMAKLQANVDNLKVEIGNAFLPVLGDLTGKLLEMWDEPETKAAIDTLIGWIGGIAGALGKVVDLVNWLAVALQSLEGRQSSVSRWQSNQAAVQAQGSQVTRWASGRASGGPVSSGGTYVVGEQGPELLNMGRSSGYITPNNKLGNVTVHLHVNSAVSLSDMANAERVLLPIVERGLRTVMAR